MNELSNEQKRAWLLEKIVSLLQQKFGGEMAIKENDAFIKKFGPTNESMVEVKQKDTMEKKYMLKQIDMQIELYNSELESVLQNEA